MISIFQTNELVQATKLFLKTVLGTPSQGCQAAKISVNLRIRRSYIDVQSIPQCFAKAPEYTEKHRITQKSVTSHSAGVYHKQREQVFQNLAA